MTDTIETTVTPKKARHQKYMESLTPEEQEARRRRLERANAAQIVIMTLLFGWTNPELIIDEWGKEITTKDGDRKFVKGWFGTSPEGEEGAYCSSNYAQTLTDSRKVVHAMAARGWGFIASLIPGIPQQEWECSFVKNGKVFRVQDADESIATAEAAVQALKFEKEATAFVSGNQTKKRGRK